MSARSGASWMTSGLAWGTIASVALTFWIALGLGGLEYYRTALAVRAYGPAHPLLRPSGPAGQTFGVVGAALMLVPFAYMARKRLKPLHSIGTTRAWLEVHLFCGIVGPVLVTFHTSFKFNGLVSAAYWSMVVVMLSGFAGRHLYQRIPRSIRGNELTRAEVDARLAQLRAELVASGAAELAIARVEDVERALVGSGRSTSFGEFVFGELLVARRLRAFDRELQVAGVGQMLRQSVVRLTAERWLLIGRAANLQRTRKLFQLWHVFHLPLVYLLLLIAAAHIALVLYMGYVPFRW